MEGWGFQVKAAGLLPKLGPIRASFVGKGLALCGGVADDDCAVSVLSAS